MNRVLIIDDALFMRQLIRDTLEPLGFNIIGEADNGIDGLKKFFELRPDLTTLDIVMPNMDGIEVLKNIREKDQISKVIMITAVDQRESMLAAMNYGVSDFIVKPFDENRIISAVGKAALTY